MELTAGFGGEKAREKACTQLCAGERLSKFKSQTNVGTALFVAASRGSREEAPPVFRVEDEGKRSDVEEGNDEGGGEKKEREGEGEEGGGRRVGLTRGAPAS